MFGFRKEHIQDICLSIFCIFICKNVLFCVDYSFNVDCFIVALFASADNSKRHGEKANKNRCLSAEFRCNSNVECYCSGQQHEHPCTSENQRPACPFPRPYLSLFTLLPLHMEALIVCFDPDGLKRNKNTYIHTK